MLGKTNNTVFDDGSFQLLYAAPYYSEATSEFDYGSPYNQVRLAQIYGATPKTGGNFSFNSGLEYQAKNIWRAKVGIGVFRDQDDIYYGFQNMTINSSVDQNNVDANSPELWDDYISVKRWLSKLSVSLSYDLPLKTALKAFIFGGYSYKLQFFSTYSSEVTKNADQYIGSEINRQIKDYYNTKVFQDRLYQEISSDGLSHYISAGIGARWFSADIRFEWMRSIGNGSSDYYIGQNIFNLKINYSIISKGLF